MATAAIEFVITEHPRAMTRPLERHYDLIRSRIQRLAGVPVRSRHYLDRGGFHADAVILSGSFAPWAAHDPDALAGLGEDVSRFEGFVLGICAGMQLQTVFAGGAIGPRASKAVGYARVEVLEPDGLLNGLGRTAVAYEHHAWEVTSLPADFVVLARSEDCAVEAVRARERGWWGTQFHPERFSARHPDGARVLCNFFALAGIGMQQSDAEIDPGPSDHAGIDALGESGSTG